jgi:hypothetical protein
MAKDKFQMEPELRVSCYLKILKTNFPHQIVPTKTIRVHMDVWYVRKYSFIGLCYHLGLHRKKYENQR